MTVTVHYHKREQPITLSIFSHPTQFSDEFITIITTSSSFSFFFVTHLFSYLPIHLLIFLSIDKSRWLKAMSVRKFWLKWVTLWWWHCPLDTIGTKHLYASSASVCAFLLPYFNLITNGWTEEFSTCWRWWQCCCARWLQLSPSSSLNCHNQPTNPVWHFYSPIRCWSLGFIFATPSHPFLLVC